MNARITVTVFPEDQSADSAVSLLVKSLEGSARCVIGIESEGKSAGLSLTRGPGGDPEITLDGQTIRQLGELMTLSFTRLIGVLSTLNFQTGDGFIKADRNLALIGEALLNLGGESVNIGSKHFKLKSDVMATIIASMFNISASQQFNLKSPRMQFDGLVQLGSTNCRPIAREGDMVQVMGVKPGEGTATGMIMKGGQNLSS